MVDHELNELKREFLDEAREKITEMRTALDNRAADRLDLVAYLAHQLKGSGGSYGFQAITTNAAELERVAERAHSDGDGAGEDLERFLGSLSAEIERAASELEAAAPAS